MFKFLTIICSVVVLSHELVLKTADDDTKSFYQIEKVDKPEELPIIIRHIKNYDSKVLKYKIIAPDDKFDAYDMEDGKNYLIIKSKKEAIDVVPYGLVQRLDKIKYMILWLNLYCEMHPDCDKSVLDEELRKVSHNYLINIPTYYTFLPAVFINKEYNRHNIHSPVPTLGLPVLWIFESFYHICNICNSAGIVSAKPPRSSILSILRPIWSYF